MIFPRKIVKGFILCGVVILFILILIIGMTNPVFVKSGQKAKKNVSTSNLKKHVNYLCNISPSRNSDNIQSLDQAARYIFQQLREYGYIPVYQEYTDQGKTFRNVIARIGPPEEDRIVIGAHYDVCGDQPGADDNASGVAGLLEIARLLRVQTSEIGKSIELVFYPLEEPPYFRTEKMGSYLHAKMLKNNNVRVKGMICLESIGYFNDQPNSQRFPVALLKWLYPTTGNYIALVGSTKEFYWLRAVKKAMTEETHLPVCSVNAPSFIPGIDFSDHQNYWKLGFPAIMITNTALYRNPHYHQPSDDPATLDYNRMAMVVEGVWAFVHEGN